jgi:hypothetical protein
MSQSQYSFSRRVLWVDCSEDVLKIHLNCNATKRRKIVPGGARICAPKVVPYERLFGSVILHPLLTPAPEHPTFIKGFNNTYQIPCNKSCANKAPGCV